MLRVYLYLAAFVAGAISLAFIDPSTTPFILVTGAMIALVVPLLDELVTNRRDIRLTWYCARYANQSVRLSVSYLFRIKVDNSYLLIRGRRWPQFQPVGGVYKYIEGAKGFLSDIGTRPDDLVRADDVSLNDLRIRIPGHKILAFVRWFESGRSRETAAWREFYEELIKPGLLSLEDFPFVVTDFIRRDIRRMRFSTHARSRELLIADIYEVMPTQEQLAALRNLKSTKHPDLVWASEEQIVRRGVIAGEDQEIEISTTAQWIL
jgi:hypothetical protein